MKPVVRNWGGRVIRVTNKMNTGYDIIGDIHGCANTLCVLLERLGYTAQYHNGWPVFSHPARKAIFLGDVVDRGPRIREALHVVKNMVDAGAGYCVMGNHEYDALGYTTRAPEQSPKTWVREHTPRNNRLIAETLNQFASYPEEWRMFLDWFQSLPLFLEMPGFRVVHACWDQELIEAYWCKFDSNTVSRDFVRDSALPGSFEAKFMDRLTRGTDLSLPDGRKIIGKDGLERGFFRTKFWADSPETFRDVVFQPDPLPEDIRQRALSREQKLALVSYSHEQIPVFIGHYWLEGTPHPLKDNLACLDYSAVKYGHLASYRFDGEAQLSGDKFMWVTVTQDPIAGHFA
ncbi:calcineurin-like phosphoesterase family protein [Alteromonadaceae bacterium 2753L.S.0a.02]|nr:calcineurin-like phosphoesterase family protein [Alteromonadaceae bacterium 2753L.S.0a.02]